MPEYTIVLITVIAFILIGGLVYIIVRDYQKGKAMQEERRLKLLAIINRIKPELAEAIKSSPNNEVSSYYTHSRRVRS